MPVKRCLINPFLYLLHSSFCILHFALSSGPRVGFIINLLQPFHRDVGVNLGRGKTGVAKQFLDTAQIGAGIQQVGSERMPQGMRR